MVCAATVEMSIKMSESYFLVSQNNSNVIAKAMSHTFAWDSLLENGLYNGWSLVINYPFESVNQATAMAQASRISIDGSISFSPFDLQLKGINGPPILIQNGIPLAILFIGIIIIAVTHGKGEVK